MPLSKVQTDILQLLAAHRDPESYVAGATPLNRNTTRYSSDIDVFHDREERVAVAALHDVNVLETAGYRVAWLRQLPLIYAAEVTHGDASTRMEWVVDSDYRFFPTIRDALSGYVLQPVDLALNKLPYLWLHQPCHHPARSAVDLSLLRHDPSAGSERCQYAPGKASPCADAVAPRDVFRSPRLLSDHRGGCDRMRSAFHRLSPREYVNSGTCLT